MRESDITDIAAQMHASSRILIITGAGISADSGLPVYRGQGGVYEGIPFEEILTPKTLGNNRHVIWDFLRELESARRNASPCQGHKIIAQLQQEMSDKIHLFTQNVDGLHQVAGSEDVVELHGNLYCIRCEHCGWTETLESYDDLDDVLLCPLCNYLTRPDVVLFEEMLPFKANQRLIQEMQKGFDMGFAIGTTGSFYYIRRPFEVIREAGGVVVEINPCDTAISDLATHKLRTTASNGLAAIVANN